MKSFDSRTYSINDFLEWDRNNQLILNPQFQRRSVWSDTARSYLMDTIVRGKPIPKIFIRQKIDPVTRTSLREVVDGQQRLRTILSFLKDGFQISRRHHKIYGGHYFSQLDEVDSEIQTNILNYEISVDLLTNLPDGEILDIFGRLNSYAVVLNENERINANHFGPFKSLADRMAHRYNSFWLDSKILIDRQIVRMEDSGLTADLLIAMIEGIRSKKQIKPFYLQYETNFPYDIDVLETQFDTVISTISGIFGGTLRYTEFRRIHVFYSLFTAVFHSLYGLKDFDLPKHEFSHTHYDRIRIALENVGEIFEHEDIRLLNQPEAQFLQDSRRATTDAKVRERRTEYLVTLINRAIDSYDAQPATN